LAVAAGELGFEVFDGAVDGAEGAGGGGGVQGGGFKLVFEL
jgi:hypothetical protein